MGTKGRASPKREPIITNRIRWCRLVISRSQQELAFLMGLPMSRISRWEKGERRPNVYNAIGLAVATRHLVDDLFLDYRREWKEKIGKREKLLKSKVEKVLPESKDDHSER